MPLKTAIFSAAQSGFYVALPGFRGALPAPLLRNVLRTPLQCLPCFFMLPVGIGAQKSLGNPIKCMALQKKKLADTSAAGAGGAGESPFRREGAARPEEWSRKAEPRKYHTRGMSCSREVLAEKSQAPQKKKKKFTLNSAIFLCKVLQTFEKFTKLCKLYMA